MNANLKSALTLHLKIEAGQVQENRTLLLHPNWCTSIHFPSET